MDYVVEARKFIQRAVDADHPDVVKEHLKIADWCLCQEIQERDDPSNQKETLLNRVVRARPWRLRNRSRLRSG
jgi:hypothetical protein